MFCAEYSPNYYGVFFGIPVAIDWEVCCRTVGLDWASGNPGLGWSSGSRVDDLRGAGDRGAAVGTSGVHGPRRRKSSRSTPERLPIRESRFGRPGTAPAGGMWRSQELKPCFGELKSMRTASGSPASWVARRLLEHILLEAQRRGYRRVSLETGSMPWPSPPGASTRAPGLRSANRSGSYRPIPTPVGFFTESGFGFVGKEVEYRSAFTLPRNEMGVGTLYLRWSWSLSEVDDSPVSGRRNFDPNMVLV